MSGDLEGDFDGEEVDVDIDFVYSDYRLNGSFEGKVDGDSLEGELDINGAGVSLSLDCELER